MRLIKKWRIVLIICVAAIAIPIAARVSPTQTEFVEPAQVNQYQPTTVAYTTEVAETPLASKTGVGHRATPPQDYYDRRREYWEDRMERRADYLEQEDGNDEDSADSKDSEDSAGSDDDEGSMDEEEEMIEKRREYWRDRLDRDW
jgi:hypothetical protein